MKYDKSIFLSGVILLFLITVGCNNTQNSLQYDIVEVAESDHLWTGIAVSSEGRIFTNFPRWSPSIPMSVAELDNDGNPIPFPNVEWNAWDPEKDDGREQFVCVQSVVIDGKNRLWILDPAMSIFHRGVLEGAAKLVEVDLTSNKIVRTIYFDASIAPRESYLNDVRIDTDNDIAYITDSGLGAIIIVDLAKGQSRRQLSDHPSVKAEDVVLNIEGKEWLQPNGAKPQIHSDGIALTSDGKYLYYQALTGRRLYRIKTNYLQDPTMNDKSLGARVETVAESGASDGIGFDNHGNLILTSIELNAIRALGEDRKIQTLAKDERLKWPDSVAMDSDGNIFVTTSQIHLGGQIEEPFRILKLVPKR